MNFLLNPVLLGCSNAGGPINGTSAGGPINGTRGSINSLRMNISTRILAVVVLLAVLSPSSTNGQALHRLNSGTTETLYSIAFPTDSLGAAVGANGILSITIDGGSSWSSSLLDPLFGGNLRAIFLEDSANGAIVGDSGIIYSIRSDQQPIRNQLFEERTIRAITFASYQVAVLAGDAGLVYRSPDSGKSWTKLTLPVLTRTKNFYGVEYLDDSSYFIIGEGGIVLFTGDAGTTWQHITVPTSHDLYSITFPDTSSNGWIVGDQTILYTKDGGDTWTSVPTTANLRCVVGDDGLHATACGLSGALLSTSDQVSWSPIQTGTTANLYSLVLDSLFVCGDSGIILSSFAPKAEFALETQFHETQLQFPSIVSGTDTTLSDLRIENTSTLPVTIKSISFDSVEFSDLSANDQVPFTVAPGQMHSLAITFGAPSGIAQLQSYHSIIHVVSSEAGEQEADLFADASPAVNGVRVPFKGAPAVQQTVPPSMRLVIIGGNKQTVLELPSSSGTPLHFDVTDAIGRLMFTTNISESSSINARFLPTGAYFYRASAGTASVLGKFIIW